MALLLFADDHLLAGLLGVPLGRGLALLRVRELALADLRHRASLVQVVVAESCAVAREVRSALAVRPLGPAGGDAADDSLECVGMPQAHGLVVDLSGLE